VGSQPAVGAGCCASRGSSANRRPSRTRHGHIVAAARPGRTRGRRTRGRSDRVSRGCHGHHAHRYRYPKLEGLRGRTVCLTEGGGLVGQMQARHGAIEKVFRAPADALLDLRIGGCGAAVHDSTMLEAVLAFPEWKKFSARLPVQREKDLAFILPKDEPALIEAVQSEVRQWRQTDLLARLTRQSAQDIA